MNNLKREAEKIALTPEEKSAMRAQLFGLPAQAGVPSPVAARPSPYAFRSHKWMSAFAALVIVAGLGTSTAFAAEGALPGEPLYALKTAVIEPVQVALAPTPAAKAAVNANIAQTRVEEAEALAQAGALDATTTASLAANFDAHAQSAAALAAAASTTDPAAAVAVEAQLSADAAAGGTVLAVLGDHSANAATRANAQALAARVLARAERHSEDVSSASSRGVVAVATASATAKVQTFAARAPTPAVPPASAQPTSSAVVRTMAVATVNPTTAAPEPAATTTNSAFTTAPSTATAFTVSASAAQSSAAQVLAAELEQKAQNALDAARGLVASSTLNATSTARVSDSLGNIESLMSQGSTALGALQYGAAVDDFTQALSQALQLSALLEAAHKFDHSLLEL